MFWNGTQTTKLKRFIDPKFLIVFKFEQFEPIFPAPCEDARAVNKSVRIFASLITKHWWVICYSLPFIFQENYKMDKSS